MYLDDGVTEAVLIFCMNCSVCSGRGNPKSVKSSLIMFVFCSYSQTSRSQLASAKTVSLLSGRVNQDGVVRVMQRVLVGV